MSHRPNFPPNPYSQGMPGWQGDPSPRQSSPGMGYSGTPRQYNPRGYIPFHSPSSQGPPHTQQGGGRPRFSPSHFQQSPYSPGSDPRSHYRGGGSGGGGWGRGGNRTPPFGSRGARNNTPHSGRRPHHGSGAGIEQYYKHSMVEDPWRNLTAK